MARTQEPIPLFKVVKGDQWLLVEQNQIAEFEAKGFTVAADQTTPEAPPVEPPKTPDTMTEEEVRAAAALAGAPNAKTAAVARLRAFLKEKANG